MSELIDETDDKAARAERRAEAAQRNRERMPLTAATMDEFRRVFGQGIKLVWAKEGRHEVGNRSGGKQ